MTQDHNYDNKPSLPKTICFGGSKQSGKDTCAEYLQNFDYEILKAATPIKLMLTALFKYCGFTDELIYEYLEGSLKEEPIECLGGKTPRELMQSLGTEWGRDLVDPDIWINLLCNRISLTEKSVISDVRFPNEVAKLRDQGGVLVQIYRPSISNNDSHSSENLLTSHHFDDVIVNDGTLDELYDKLLRTLTIG